MNEEILMILQICCNKFGVTEARVKGAFWHFGKM